MKNRWETVRLGDICEIYQPKTISAKEMVDDGAYPVFGANGIIGRYNNFNHEDPQLLITCRGATCGSVNLSMPNSWITGNAMVVRPRNGSLNLRFLEYMFRGGVDISKTITGAAQPQITRTNLAPIQISFPPIDEQKRMVAILDEVFEAIDKAKQNAEKNLQNARELFESYLQNIFANPGFDSAKKRVDEVSHLVDSLHKTPEYTTDGFPMVRVTDIKPGILNYSKAKRVSRETFEEFSKRHKPREGDIVFARVGSFGVSSIVGSNDAFCLGQNTVFIVPSINPHYLYYFLNTSDAREQINNLVAGTTQGTISLKSIKEILLPVVEESNQSLIVNRINEVSAQTNKLGQIYLQRITVLNVLKKSILQKAFNGHI